jgi:hypothetical protein
MIFQDTGGRVREVVHPMTNFAATRYRERNLSDRLDQVLKDALSTPRKPLFMTATLKRRALKQKLEKPHKKAGKGAAFPAI